MRTAIISDIHGNLEAFKEVLKDIDQSKVDEVVCLGDNIGYGPEPEAVVRLVRERQIPSVMGNHELTVLDPRYLDWMNPMARKTVILTHQLLSSETADYIRNLKPALTCNGALFVHGCPPDSMTTYLFEISKEEYPDLFRSIDERICFVGHTHDLQLITFDGRDVCRAPLSKGMTSLREGCHYIANVGSVGQPRDGNNNAKYVIWDDAAHTLDLRFIPYRIAVTADKIMALGFPEYNARRLW